MLMARRPPTTCVRRAWQSWRPQPKLRKRSRHCAGEIRTSEPTERSTPDLLLRLLRQCGAKPEQLKVRVASLADGRGRRLVATAELDAEEVILSVPFTSILMDTEVDEDHTLPWSARMALQLLAQRHRCSKPSWESHEMAMQSWISSLPSSVPLPFLDFSDAELYACQDDDVVLEATNVSSTLRECFVVEGDWLAAHGYGWQDFAWAVSVMHSRSFTFGPALTHLTVPGIDMANHSDYPNATVRIQHNPSTVQGQAASEEVCEPQTPEPSRFELLAGPQHIRPGEEVTVTYGSWSNEVFYLFFGFIPEHNPFDAVVLYRNLDELVLHYMRMKGHIAQGTACSEVDLREALAKTLGEGDWTRMVVMAGGFDRRTVHAVRAIAEIDATDASAEAVRPGDMLVQRCFELLHQYPTTLEEDEALLQTGGHSQHLSLSIRYRIGKKVILNQALRGMR